MPRQIHWRSECPSRALSTLPEREALWVVSAAIADFRRKISCGQLLSIDAVLDALAEKGDISDASAEKNPAPGNAVSCTTPVRFVVIRLLADLRSP